MPSTLQQPSLIVGTRTWSTIGITMYTPGVSTTDVLGYRLFRNEANSNAVPTVLAYNGEAISNVQAATVTGLVSGQRYWFAYSVLNRAGWSELSPYLEVLPGKLPAPPTQPPR